MIKYWFYDGKIRTREGTFIQLIKSREFIKFDNASKFRITLTNLIGLL